MPNSFFSHVRLGLSLHTVALLVATPAAAEETDAVPPVEGVVIHGQRTPGYAARGQITGSRAPRPVSDVPQSISVVPRAVLEDTSARRIDDALTLTPSVQLGSGFGLLWEDYYVRGSRVWSGTLFRNGYLSGYSGISATDAVNVQRVEVLRGPAAALYGPGLPGGSINVITKRPDTRAAADVGFGVGSFGTQRTTLDATGPLSPSVAYRFAGAFDRTEGYRDFNDANRAIANPSALIAISDTTRVLLETQVFRVRYRPDSRGVPIVDGDPFALPNHRSLVEPDTPMTVFDGALLRTEIEHRVNPTLAFRVGVQRQAALQDERAVIFLGVRDDGRTLDRLPTHYRARSDDVALQAGAEWKPRTGDIEHDVVLGTDLRYERVAWRVGAAAEPYPIDLFDPRYGEPAPAVAEQTGPDNEWTYGDAGLYVNDVVRLTPSLRVVVSGRVDAYEQASVAPIAAVDEDEGELALSGRAGVVYDWTRAVSTYASVSRGFWPVLGVSADAKLLAPERSLGAEVGARLGPDPDRLWLDVSAFQTWNRNITLPDPLAPDFQVQRDLAVSRGVEAMVTARPVPALRLIGSYTLADARVTEDSDPALVDSALPFVSRHSGGGFAMVDIPVAPWVVELGGGFRAVGERHLNDGTPVPGYGRADATAGVRAASAALRLLVQNAFDARFVQSGNDRTSVLFGARRSLYLSLTASL